MCTRPSAVWMTAGYEYSPGSLSSTSAASHVLPSPETATFSGVRPCVRVVVDEEVRPSRERDGVDARVGIRQRGERHRRPRAARVGRPSLEDALRPRAPDGLKHAVRMDQDARLNRIDAASVGGGRREYGGPRQAAVGRPLEVHAPDARPIGRLGAARRNDGAVGEPHRLVLDRTEDAVGQAARVAPCLPGVGATFAPCPTTSAGWDRPCRRASAVRRRLEQHRIPARDAACRPAARRWRPRPAPSTARARCRDSQMPTSGAPSRVPPNHAVDEPGARLDDRRGMGAGERRGLVDELGPYLVGCAHDSDDEQHRCELPHLLDPSRDASDTPNAAMLTPGQAGSVSGVTSKEREFRTQAGIRPGHR